jgi:manganese efflux pump family protein
MEQAAEGYKAWTNAAPSRRYCAPDPSPSPLSNVTGVLALLLVALSLGLSNFAAAIGLGVAGADAGTRLRMSLIFGIFEAGMPILGLLLGHRLARALGGAAHWIGAVLLIATGGYAVRQAARSQARDEHQPAAGADRPRTGRLLVTGAALSIDNLAVGFALGAYHVSLTVAAVIIGAVSVTLSLAGLELGERLGTKVGERGELIGGLVLIAVGIAIASGVL